VPFVVLLETIVQAHGVEPKVLVQPGRQRAWVRARAMLVYLAREWTGLRAKEVGQRLQRDPSVISRLYARYAANREEEMEARLSQAIHMTEREVNMQA
jgi:chromosomal replication initiation ATPase DnaA